MQINLIGTGAMYTAYNSACTLIDNKIIVDMPNGTVKQMLKNGLPVENIDIILITHMHGDHTADIPFFLKYVFNYKKRNTPINIIGPIGIKSKIKDLFDSYNFENGAEIERFFNIHFIEILENDFKINEYNIKSYLMLHGEEKPALGYIIDNKLGITGDSGLCEGIETIFKKSTVIIADSSSKTGDMCHMGINDLIYLSNKYNKKIFCTHLLDTTRRELIENVHQNIIVKDDFYVSEI